MDNKFNIPDISDEVLRELSDSLADSTIKNMVAFAKNYNKGCEQHYINQLKEAGKEGVEEGHMIADQILCELLSFLGYKELVDVYNGIRKWYA